MCAGGGSVFAHDGEVRQGERGSVDEGLAGIFGEPCFPNARCEVVERPYARDHLKRDLVAARWSGK
ncbi:MAG: hypothetical protein WDM89_19450 [Rhizomicrobium sp.]